ncbi:TraM recognition domain-containing protein [Cereibacter sphaeroides]|uniref:TraM recognition domain-containing protein n=1 Tax=Cereibacter sphaeroides TaxID=1063 RepID=UPI001F1D4017|nr:TraM recognition domain-containing protein [Cereibacter sphaeroides]MCE6959699.1 TraM recognition domain-containing protein [Cereibacter sphaeroides]MCE6974440.1 TraM recognition domain-containing protein [Cereibacter sphaeroides]
MAEYQKKTPNLPSTTVDPGMVRRPIRSLGQEIRDMAASTGTVLSTLVAALLLLLLVPESWLLVVPVVFGYYGWVTSLKFRLPFKVPQTWGGLDYGAPKPGGRGFGKAAGILYLGQDQATNEELWIENGDARRHGFFLGTTGSGKALPLDTPILTPRGWVMNGDLRPGDEVCHPDGGTSRILSVHPQGEIPAVRIWFSDGRFADCSLEHLWQVRGTARPGEAAPQTGVDLSGEGRLMTAGDIGILSGLHGAALALGIPRAEPHQGFDVEEGSGPLSAADARRAAERGLASLDYMPSLHGTPDQRRGFLRVWAEAARPTVSIEPHGVRLHGLEGGDARVLKQIVWSLGGTAIAFIEPAGACDLILMFEGIGGIFEGAGGCTFAEEGLGIVAVERLDTDIAMSCIRVDREDGLYVMENHLVTHNTELLLGVVSQTLMWSSGFLFIDGKGTTEFYARAWTLAKRFGREDDVRVLNFTDAGGDPDAPAGGPATQSNTVNPFAKGDPGQLMNLVVSLMGDAGKGNDMWKARAMTLVTAEMKALCELRDSGEILLNVQTIRDFLFLGKGFDKTLLKSRKISKVEDVPQEAWDEMRTRAGLIELYLRALIGEFSEATRLAMKGFFDTLPGFSIEKALNGDPQDAKCNEQYGFLSMQLTKPLGSLADDYGHIFRTPLGEVDMMDVVLNRRILVVLLPALQKAREEMENCGRIVVTLLKMLMGNTSGYMLQGSKQEIVDSKQTRAPSPYIVVLDEAGYYMVDGIDVMMAQARSLGFMIIVAGQDMSAMQKNSPQIAETAAANASIFAAGKTTDGDKTVRFIQSLFGRTQVSVTSGYSSEAGLLSNRWVDRMDASFQEVEKVKIDELQHMMEGEFYFLFNGTLVKAATFYVGNVGKDGFGKGFSVNKFLKVRGPMDRVPGLDQSVDIAFVSAFVGSTEAIIRLARSGVPPEAAEGASDSVAAAARIANALLWRAGEKSGDPARIRAAWQAGILGAGTAAPAAVPGAQAEEGWEDDLDLDALTALQEDPDLADPDPVSRQTWLGRGRGEDHADPRSRGRADALRGDGRSGRGLDDGYAFLEEDPAIRASTGLDRVVRGRNPHERHGGMIDLLVAQEAAKAKVRSADDIDSYLASQEAETRREAVEAQRSLGDFFTFVAENSARLAQVFAEEDIEGELGLEILRRSGNARPLPLHAIKDTSFLNAALGELEKIITTE